MPAKEEEERMQRDGAARTERVGAWVCSELWIV
jgi:hypothetical protein